MSSDPLDQIIEVQRQQADALLTQHTINQQLSSEIHKLVRALTALYKIQQKQMQVVMSIAEKVDDPAVRAALVDFQQSAVTELLTLSSALSAGSPEEEE